MWVMEQLQIEPQGGSSVERERVKTGIEWWVRPEKDEGPIWKQLDETQRKLGENGEVRCGLALLGSLEEAKFYQLMFELAEKRMFQDKKIPRVASIVGSTTGSTSVIKITEVGPMATFRIGLVDTESRQPRGNLIFFARNPQTSEVQFRVALRVIVNEANNILESVGKEKIPVLDFPA